MYEKGLGGDVFYGGVLEGLRYTPSCKPMWRQQNHAGCIRQASEAWRVAHGTSSCTYPRRMVAERTGENQSKRRITFFCSRHAQSRFYHPNILPTCASLSVAMSYNGHKIHPSMKNLMLHPPNNTEQIGTHYQRPVFLPAQNARKIAKLQSETTKQEAQNQPHTSLPSTLYYPNSSTDPYFFSSLSISHPAPLSHRETEPWRERRKWTHTYICTPG